jgi:DNA-binding transcriptional LysR family regulator
MLDIRRLKVFHEVAQLGSFSAAAVALDYSQPAISHHISRLELEVGARLLERTSSRGGVVLTDAGRVLLRHAAALLARMEDAEAELAEVTLARDHTLRLGAFATASATIVVDAIARLRRVCPDISLTLVEGEYPETIERLKGRHIDIAVVFDDPLHPVPPDELVEISYVYEDPILLMMPGTHRLARQETVDLADLTGDDWIEGAGRETPCSLILVTACEAAGFEPRIAFNSGNYQVVQRLVAAGVGVALVPELALAGAGPGVVTRPLASQLSRRVGVAVRRGGYQRPPVKAMLTELENACRGRAAHQAVHRLSADFVA